MVGPQFFTMNVGTESGNKRYKTDMKRLDLQLPEAEMVPVKKYENQIFPITYTATRPGASLPLGTSLMPDTLMHTEGGMTLDLVASATR